MYCPFMIIGRFFLIGPLVNLTVNHQVICNHCFNTRYISPIFFLLTVFLPNRKTAVFPNSSRNASSPFVYIYPVSTLYEWKRYLIFETRIELVNTFRNLCKFRVQKYRQVAMSYLKKRFFTLEKLLTLKPKFTSLLLDTRSQFSGNTWTLYIEISR